MSGTHLTIDDYGGELMGCIESFRVVLSTAAVDWHG